MLSKKHFDTNHHISSWEFDNKYLAIIYPADMGDYLECVKLLNAGHGPISDGWEDGLGNACTMDGWGDAE